MRACSLTSRIVGTSSRLRAATVSAPRATLSIARRAKHARSDEPGPVPFDDDPPEHAVLASIVVAVRPVHRGAVVDDQHVALAPAMVIHDGRLDRPVEQLAHVELARLGSHAGDVGGLGDVKVHGSACPSRALNVVSDSSRLRSSSGRRAYASRMFATLVPPPAEGISTP